MANILHQKGATWHYISSVSPDSRNQLIIRFSPTEGRRKGLITRQTENVPTQYKRQKG
ncbi:hypothetical protein ACSBR1_042466 [Camellia fascicularis]